MASGSEEGIKQELRCARTRDQLHHAYLLEGGRGTDAIGLGLWLARLLLCRQGAEEPCGVCHDCRLLSSGAGETTPDRPRHPDLKLVEPDGAFIKVDQIRELQRDLSLAAFEGGRRVALILGAERLRLEAANALLKTLEEPPQATVLLLVAASSQGLPRTLRSRTVRLRLVAGSEAELRAQLREQGLDATDAWLASAVGGGTAEAAQSWAESWLEAAREMHGVLDGIADLGATQILDFAEGFRGGEPARTRAELLVSVHDAHARRGAELAAERGDVADLARWLDRFDAGQRARREMLRRNLNPQLVVEGLLLDLRASTA